MVQKDIKTYTTNYILITRSTIQIFYKKLNLNRHHVFNKIIYTIQQFNYEPFKRERAQRYPGTHSRVTKNGSANL